MSSNVTTVAAAAEADQHRPGRSAAPSGQPASSGC